MVSSSKDPNDLNQRDDDKDSVSESLKEFMKSNYRKQKAEKEKLKDLETIQVELQFLEQRYHNKLEEFKKKGGEAANGFNEDARVKHISSGSRVSMSQVTDPQKENRFFKPDLSWVTGCKCETDFLLWSQTFKIKVRTYLSDLKELDEERFLDLYESALLVGAEKGNFRKMERDVACEIKLGKLRGPEILKKLESMYNTDKNIIVRRNESKAWIRTKLCRKRGDSLFKSLMRLDVCIQRCEENQYQPREEEKKEAL